MSVSTTDTVVTATLTGETDTIPVSFPFTAAGDLTVKNTTLGLTLGLGVDYSVAGGGTTAGGGYATGSVTIIDTSATTSNQAIEIRRVTPRTQDTEYVQGGRFSTTTTETALDKLTLISQEVNDDTFVRSDFGTVSGAGVYGTDSLSADSWRSDEDLAEDLAIVTDAALNSRLSAFENAALKFFGTTVISNEADLATAISDANADSTVTVRRTLGAQIPITANKSIPVNLDLNVPPATGFSMTAGKTLEMLGAINAGGYQIFFGDWVSGASSSFFGRNGDNGFVDPRWWGATVINLTDIATESDSYAAFRAAIDFWGVYRSGGGAQASVRVPWGRFKLTASLDLWSARSAASVSLIGDGSPRCGLAFYNLGATYCVRMRSEAVQIVDLLIECGEADYGIYGYENVSELTMLKRVNVTNFAKTGIDFSDALGTGSGVTGGTNIFNCVISEPSSAAAIGIDASVNNQFPVALNIEKCTIIDPLDQFKYGVKTVALTTIRHLNVEGFTDAAVFSQASASQLDCGFLTGSPAASPSANAAFVQIEAGSNLANIHVYNTKNIHTALPTVYDIGAAESYMLGDAAGRYFGEYRRYVGDRIVRQVTAGATTYVVEYTDY